MKVTTYTAQERNKLADKCLRDGLNYHAVEHHLRDAMPETLLPRLGKVVYEITKNNCNKS